MNEDSYQELARLREQIAKQEKMASLGMLTAGIAHEIQNPLNFVINFSKMSGKLLEDLEDILSEGSMSCRSNISVQGRFSSEGLPFAIPH